jgi:hypothetical protein
MQTEEIKRKKLYDYLSQASQKAYSNIYLIANDVLAKSETRGRILEFYLKGVMPSALSLVKKIIKINQYYLKSTAWFFLYLLAKVVHLLSGQKYIINEGRKFYALDVYFVVSDILRHKKFKDHYLTGLAERLDKSGERYVYIPRWFDSWNPISLFRTFRILKKKGYPVLTEFQLLEWPDYGRALVFLVTYPFHIWKFIGGLGDSIEDKLLHFALWETLDTVTLKSYMRYLFGREVSCLKNSEIKCISLYENQASEKIFFRGLRHVPGKIKVFGTQLAVQTKTGLNVQPDESEIRFGVVPDKVLVNGPGYNFGLKIIPEEVGPSLRYEKLFRVKVDPSRGGIVLIVLPWSAQISRYVLEFIKEIDWPAAVVVKAHPTVSLDQYAVHTASKFSVTDEDLYALFSRARMVVGRSTGALIEAACLGIPVIELAESTQFSHDCMPEYGRGVLWDKAIHEEDASRLVRQFEEALRLDASKLQVMGEKMRDKYFCEPTEEKYIRAFDLA